MNRILRGGLFFILGGTILAACSRSSGPTVAKIGSEEITVPDLKARLQETPAAYQQYVGTTEGRRQFLNIMVREKVVLAEARKAGLDHDEAYRTAVADYKN